MIVDQNGDCTSIYKLDLTSSSTHLGHLSLLHFLFNTIWRPDTAKATATSTSGRPDLLDDQNGDYTSN